MFNKCTTLLTLSFMIFRGDTGDYMNFGQHVGTANFLSVIKYYSLCLNANFDATELKLKNTNKQMIN